MKKEKNKKSCNSLWMRELEKGQIGKWEEVVEGGKSGRE
jgi:hypothetical protein